VSNLHVHQLLQALKRGPAVLVSVHDVHGSGPREVGAWMAVMAGEVINTIGGGHLEFRAIDEARRLMDGGGATTRRYALGPSLGQCCGGVVHLRYEPVTLADAPVLAQRLQAPAVPVALFGGGHVGHALARVLAPLPFALHWIDSRDEVFPAQVDADTLCEHSDPVQAAVPELAPQSMVLIMSFSHAEDLDIVAACLARQRERADLPFIGLIGSRTKWATFSHRLQARGFSDQELAQVTCPIGVSGITGKEPEVIAVAVAAQLLQRLGTN